MGNDVKARKVGDTYACGCVRAAQTIQYSRPETRQDQIRCDQTNAQTRTKSSPKSNLSEAKANHTQLGMQAKRASDDDGESMAQEAVSVPFFRGQSMFSLTGVYGIHEHKPSCRTN